MTYTQTPMLYGMRWRCSHGVTLKDCYPTTFNYSRALSLSRSKPSLAEQHGIRLESEQPALWCTLCGKPHLL